ncbi:MAG: cytochrome c3 family protein, partial [Phycisphaerae bacterium]|nr:cytochrome c3 family protein [Phycisphaerae bacterium]MDW8263135.1 hypothetical protein [Phycisphaerales bacterium]
MARVRTQKTVASRIDLNYHRRRHPWRTTRVALVAVCTLAAAAWFALSSVRFENGRPVLVDAIHNPGPVTRAHQQFENDCRACHDGGAASGSPAGYWLHVSDAACLRCHDGSLHHANQKVAESHAGVDAAQFVHAVQDSTHPTGALSARCISCHVEHRGEEVLAASSDRHCITCHENVSRALKPGKQPLIAARVTAFTVADHPRFGRRLDSSGGASADFTWQDLTDVKFNHAKPAHAEIPPLPGAANNCTRCHEVSNGTPSAGRTEEDRSKYPPFESPTGRLLRPDWRTADYVQPVSYERHCIGCHRLTLPAGGPTIPHEEMSIVRAALANLPNDLIASLRSLSEPERKKQLTTTRREGRGPAAKTVEVTRTEEEWLKERLEKLIGPVSKPVEAFEGGTELIRRAGATFDWTYGTEKLKGPSTAVLEFYVAFAGSESCAKCHGTNQSAGDFGRLASSVPLETTPTGIGPLPRRWFPGSRFNHYAHRQLNCLDCHAAALRSEKTS